MILHEGYNYAQNFFNANNAATYDSVVSLATLGRDKIWKTQIAKIIEKGKSIPPTVLDLAAGTGILSAMLDRKSYPSTVLSLDLTLDYLKKAKEKHPTLSLINSTAEILPFRSETFDFIVSSYLAKYIDIETVVRESWRVLKHDGVIVFHDFTVPSDPVVERFWKFHFQVLRLSGKILKEWAPTFNRLDTLIFKTDPWPENTIQHLRKAGFIKSFCKRHTLGTSAIVSARKP